MPVNDELGERMKMFYESVPKTKLIRRMPVAIRLDGKAFHTFTKGFKKPFDDILIKTMQETMKYLCENIQGCVLGYTQSDEITLILVDYKKLNSCAWFDYEVQKMCSIASSMATVSFNKYFRENVALECGHSLYDELITVYTNKFDKAMFDSRVFNIPKEEVTNLLYWRQLDATRNSIQMLGQSVFSHKELQNKSCNDIQNMLLIHKNINWNDLETVKKRGTCCLKVDYDENAKTNYLGDVPYSRPHWIIDKEIPIFNHNREYIDRLISF